MSHHKCKFNSTFGSIHETVITNTGTSRTSRANLSKICVDRLALEQENLQSHRELSDATQQVLAEATLYANNYSNNVGDSFADLGGSIGAAVAMDGDVVDSNDSMEEDKGSEMHPPVSGHDRHTVSAARTQVFKCIQGRHRCRCAPRSRLIHNCAMQNAWQDQMPSLAKAFLLWKQNPCLPSTQAPTTSFHVTAVDISNILEQSVDQAHDELANVSLLKSGYLGCSPLQPTLAISLSCLKLYRQIRWRKPSFSVQAIIKVLCALHNRTYFQSLRDQFAVAFDAYLAIVREVKNLVDQVLGRDTPHWHMLHACPPCNYKQPNDPPLYPAQLDTFDGNSSLKHIDGSGHADERSFQSSYLIPAAEVDLFKDDVHLCPGTRTTAGNEVPQSNDETLNNSTCTKNWKAANTTSENSTNVFNQTGVFVSACCHGIVQTLVELRRSGELANHALAMANKLIDVYGANGLTGYDIGCSFSKTITVSSINDKVKHTNHHFIVNAFHGHAHNRRCQLQYHTLYQKGLGIEDLETCEHVFAGSNTVAPLIRHASYFHWLQFIDLQFDQWDQDHYEELSQFLYNNYHQALHIINELTPAIEELKQQLDLSNADFKQWNIEELQYLEALAAEPEYDREKLVYVEVLQSLAKAEAEYGSITSIQFLSYAPANFTQNSGLHKGPQAVTKAHEAECRAAHNKLALEMNAVLDLERQLDLMKRWTPHDPKYQEALKYLNNRRFIHVVQHLEGLVVQRLFELAKANLAGTGYKMRQQISNAITRCSTAICNVLKHYNRLVPLQSPPQDILKFSDVASYAWLGEFELLKSSQQEILTKPWVSKANREVAGKFFKIWVEDEDAYLLNTAISLEVNQPALACEICHLHDKHAIYAILGFSGVCVPESSNDGNARAVIDELQSATPIKVDEDDLLCDQAASLELCIA
ncbi:hypothetical protein C8R48DRAFT_778679 [Suillus tomentosus]|nr:hypothetical protein C8R48DRAFT_778679 [Suillus tomentosus]